MSRPGPPIDGRAGCRDSRWHRASPGQPSPRRDAIRIAGESLDELRDQLGHSVFLAIWANHGPTIVRWEEGTQPVIVNVRVGSVLPLMRSATGRVFLCWLPSALTAPILETEKANARDVERLQQATRARGLGSVEGDLLAGVASLPRRSSIIAVKSSQRYRRWAPKAILTARRRAGSARSSRALLTSCRVALAIRHR